eukprot:TRINITY_DN6949_c0_g1_i3.p1 TRINITY_DN6949_c0_g1~~TRINITY_DN6949_c0_g1_i3.p1  ORF type:complete len:102 (-),score=9.30 TRINITY_DN6949_c0_g1_i3:21-326(-)
MYLRFMNDPTNFDLYANNVYWKLNFVTEPMPNELFDVTTSKLFGFPYLPYEWDSWFAENNYPLLVAQLNVSGSRIWSLLNPKERFFTLALVVINSKLPWMS